jgi:DNA polymerase-3 subunit epsilon
MYAIIDIETTGGSPVVEKITEIAIFVHNGTRVVDEFCSLVNPEKKIPYYITGLTGISNDMVSDSPKFYEIAKKIIELTKDCCFVAHNVSFDYQFIRNEYKRLGYSFQREKICTVQLSRKLIPGLSSYSLGNLCRSLNIDILSRHRAGGDAAATVKLFEYLLKLSNNNHLGSDILNHIDKNNLHPELPVKKIHDLPESTGVYYFYNDKNELIYIGKSKNIKSRVISHFNNSSTKKAIQMRNEIADIDYELTGSELIALLKESHEIKMNIPLFNRAQRRSFSHYGIYYYVDGNGYYRFLIEKNSRRNESPLCSFSSLVTAKNYLRNKAEEFGLCHKLCDLYSGAGACFHYEISMCDGACTGKESPGSYNRKAHEFLMFHQYRHKNFFIVDTGRSAGEYALVKVDNGKYIGYGYIDKDSCTADTGLLDDCISKYNDNRDVQQIIKTYLKKNDHIRVIEV